MTNRVPRLPRRDAMMDPVLVFATSIPVSLASPTAARYWWLLTVPARLLFRETRTPENEQLAAAAE
ncbi:hypothetical protein ABZ656_13785 [Streptomyces sp. NPDC007095]|jgi:hypothetical protein|uniref:hypothetical protein n=1 Tax=Streptomyces sp. NPDC007095 TaxID=3154482 RepID=UPI0015D59C90